MIYNAKHVFAFVLIVLCLIVTSQISQAKILFEEDFEGGKLDEKKWFPKPEWKIMKPEEKIAALGNGMMGTAGGQANNSSDDSFKEHAFEAHCNAKQGGNIIGFVCAAKDVADTSYRHQIPATCSRQTTTRLRWITSLNGA